MNNIIESTKESADYLRRIGIDQPVIGVVLGTGLGTLVTQIENPLTVPYSAIPHFPEATVEFHKGQLIYGTLQNKKVLVMQGRFH